MIDADNNSKTGWYGFDYIINKDVKDEKTTKLLRYDASNVGNPWVFVTDLKMNYAANKLEIAVPRSLLGLNKNQFIFDFKWSDNTKDLIDPISFCLNGDTAPNRRFNYRCIWKK
jgi:hypothetical protein